MPISNELIVVIIIGVWLAGLTATTWLISRHYRRLVGNAKGEDLKKILNKILKETGSNKKEIARVSKEIRAQQKDGLNHIQKVGLVRFNPFSETGGDHSFSLALLDAAETGFVLTGLHTRERTRVYIKPVTKGKSKYELSKDEQKAIRQAK